MFTNFIVQTVKFIGQTPKKDIFKGVVCFLLISSLLAGCVKEEGPPGGQSMLLGKGDQAVLVTHWLTPQEKRASFDFPWNEFLGFILKGEHIIAVEKPRDLFPGETGRKIQVYGEGKLQEERGFPGPFWFALDEERENGIFQWKEKDKYYYLLWNFINGEKQEIEIKLPEGFTEVPSYLALWQNRIFLLVRSREGAYEAIVQDKDQIREFPLPEEYQPVPDPAPYSQAFFRMAVSPDGERLALYVVSNKDKGRILHILLLETFTENTLCLDFTYPWLIPGRLSWSPDGKHLIGIDSADSTSEIAVFAGNGVRVLSRLCFSAFWLDSYWILIVEWNSVAGGIPKFMAVYLDGAEVEVPAPEEGLPADLFIPPLK